MVNETRASGLAGGESTASVSDERKSASQKRDWYQNYLILVLVHQCTSFAYSDQCPVTDCSCGSRRGTKLAAGLETERT